MHRTLESMRSPLYSGLAGPASETHNLGRQTHACGLRARAHGIMPQRGAGMTRFLIAGLGSIGRRHLRNLVTLGETDIVLLRSHRATLPDAELAAYPEETDINLALEKYRPQAVIVSNPTALHLDVAIPAARQGCAILLEKPISGSMTGVSQLDEAARHHSAPILMGFQFRFHPSLLQVRQWINEQALDRVFSASVHYGEYLPGWHPWEDYRKGYAARGDLGGGVLLTQCHSLDYMRWLLGDPEAISGVVGRFSDLEVDVDDTADMIVRFPDKVTGAIHLDFAQQPPSHEVMIEGTSGSIRCDLLTGMVRSYKAGDSDWQTRPAPAGWERNSMFLDEMRHFVAVARGSAQPSCTLADGMRVMQMIEAVRKSSKSGRQISLRP